MYASTNNSQHWRRKIDGVGVTANEFIFFSNFMARFVDELTMTQNEGKTSDEFAAFAREHITDDFDCQLISNSGNSYIYDTREKYLYGDKDKGTFGLA
eukprot:898845_1